MAKMTVAEALESMKAKEGKNGKKEQAGTGK